MSYLPSVITFLLGTAIAYMNYRITLKILEKDANKAVGFVVTRQIINFAYLAAVFFIGRKLADNVNPMLIGAAVGLTVPAFIFTLSISKKMKETAADGNSETGKGENLNE